MENLTATYLLRDVEVPTCINIEGFTLEPVPDNPNNTYLRFDFISKKRPYSKSQKEIQLFSLILSILYKIEHPEFKNITDKSGERVRAEGQSIKHPLELKQKHFDKLGKAYRKVKSMTKQDKQTFEFVARWVQKASGSRNVYDKFISYWIAFNFLYRHMRPRGERKRIEEWVKTQYDNTYASKFFASFQQSKPDSPECKAIEDLADANLKLRRKPKNVSKKLKQKIKDQKFDLEALRYLVLCIYAVRNNIFHGEWPYLDKIRGHVGGAEFLLYKLIRRGLEKQCNFAF